MKSVVVTAPGKAIISGEYAVLQGAPAISMALSCRAAARVARTNDELHSVSTPGYTDGERRFRADQEGNIDWVDDIPSSGMRLVELAWRTALKPGPRSLSVALESNAFFDADTRQKLGMGSSAAVMTALVCALRQHNNTQESCAAGTLAMAQQAHAALQGGKGSGVDVATSFHGGVIQYRMQEALDATRLGWPVDLDYRVLWSGRPASTNRRLAALHGRPPNDAAWAPLISAAESVASVWITGNAADILTSLNGYAVALSHFSDAHDLGVYNAGHDELRNQAAAVSGNDLVYKPCGAGGGDIGIVVSSSGPALAEFCARARERKFIELPVHLDVQGVDIKTVKSK